MHDYMIHVILETSQLKLYIKYNTIQYFKNGMTNEQAAKANSILNYFNCTYKFVNHKKWSKFSFHKHFNYNSHVSLTIRNKNNLLKQLLLKKLFQNATVD